MSKFEIGDKIMGYSTDMLGNRLVSGNAIKIIECDPILYQTERLIIEKENHKNDTIYSAEVTHYDGWKFKQAEAFLGEADRFEKRSKELIKMVRVSLYSQNSK